MSLNLRTRGLMVVLSSPSGGGKSSLAEALVKLDCHLKLSISATTRQIRPGEVEGKHYYFKSCEEFESLINTNQLLEYTNIYGNYYGTLKEQINNTLATGLDIIFDIDWEGAKIIKSKKPDEVITIFILPPSLDVLKQRIINRAEDSRAAIEHRLQLSPEEINNALHYDYVVMNDDFDITLTQIQNIINAERSKTTRLDQLQNVLTRICAEKK